MPDDRPHVIAVDWSGKKADAAETIWQEAAVDGQRIEMRNGRSRDELIADLIARASEPRRLIAGFDFALTPPVSPAGRDQSALLSAARHLPPSARSWSRVEIARSSG